MKTNSDTGVSEAVAEKLTYNNDTLSKLRGNAHMHGGREDQIYKQDILSTYVTAIAKIRILTRESRTIK